MKFTMLDAIKNWIKKQGPTVKKCKELGLPREEYIKIYLEFLEEKKESLYLEFRAMSGTSYMQDINKIFRLLNQETKKYNGDKCDMCRKDNCRGCSEEI